MASVMASSDHNKTAHLLVGLAQADDQDVTYVATEITRLATLLTDGEEVYAITTASRHVMPGLLALAADRLIFLKRRRLIGHWGHTEIPYSTISYVGIEHLLTETLIHIRTDNRRRNIHFGVFPSPRIAEDTFRLLKRLSDQARAKKLYEARGKA